MAPVLHDPATARAEAIREVNALHAFFVDWFNGICPRDEEKLLPRLSNRLSSDLMLVFPGGAVVGRDQLIAGVRADYGMSPGFGVEIRNLAVRPMAARTHLLVTYEEWQKNAVNSTPPNNGRLSSAILQLREGDLNDLRWLHIHETWLPDPVVAADAFAFDGFSGAR